jgi:hypothetical protein
MLITTIEVATDVKNVPISSSIWRRHSLIFSALSCVTALSHFVKLTGQYLDPSISRKNFQARPSSKEHRVG